MSTVILQSVSPRALDLTPDEQKQIGKGVVDLGVVLVDTVTGGPARRAAEQAAAAKREREKRERETMMMVAGGVAILGLLWYMRRK